MAAWLRAGIRATRSPTSLVPAPGGRPPRHPTGRRPPAICGPSPLRLPAGAITESGVIDTGDQQVALVACATVNINLRTGDEQAALIGAYGRWLNSLSGPVQVTVSAQRVDLSSHATRIAAHAETIDHPALAAAARDYADFLDELATRRDPLWRTVTVWPGPAGWTSPCTCSRCRRRSRRPGCAASAPGSNPTAGSTPTRGAWVTR